MLKGGGSFLREQDDSGIIFSSKYKALLLSSNQKEALYFQVQNARVACLDKENAALPRNVKALYI